MLQQTKQCVYNIPCGCGRCYIGETSRLLEVCIKEDQYHLTQGLLENLKLAQHAYEEGHKMCWNEENVLQIEPNTTYRKYKESVHISDRPSDELTQLGHLSHLDSHCHSRSPKTTTPSSVNCVGEFFFSCWYCTENFISPVMISIIIVFWCLIRVEFLIFCLSTCRWFVLCLTCIPNLGAGTVVRIYRLALSVGPS
jgi:hypothetical protein